MDNNTNIFGKPREPIDRQKSNPEPTPFVPLVPEPPHRAPVALARLSMRRGEQFLLVRECPYCGHRHRHAFGIGGWRVAHCARHGSARFEYWLTPDLNHPATRRALASR